MADIQVQELLLHRDSTSEIAYAALLERIRHRQVTVTIVGLGRVGLPLAAAFVEAGFQVIGIDVDTSKVDSINKGESYGDDVPSETLTQLKSDWAPLSQKEPGYIDPGPAGGLTATTDFDALANTDVVIVCVPTPLSKTRHPDLSYIISATEQIACRLRPGMLIVLESTTYPGTTEELLLPRLQHANGQSLTAGTDFFLAFSPERIDPGRTDWTISNTPKIVGGVTGRCAELAKTVYECVVQQVVLVSCPKVAEMVKLLENTFRATNIALVNEIAIMCDRLGVDVWEVIEAAKTKPFGFMPFYPGPGLGGHCIPVDPQFLAWKLKTMDYNTRFIQLAEEINSGMPEYVMRKITDELNEDGKPLKGSRVLILGVAYKADVSDVRESPAINLIQLLRQKGAEVTYNDPYVMALDTDNGSVPKVDLTLERLQNADCVVISTAHSSYDWKWIVDNSQLVVDTRNATGGIPGASGRLVRL